MLGQPPVAVEVVAAVLREHWALDDVQLEYAPLGFGSYHWWATAGHARLFATLDDFGGMEDPAERARRIDSLLRACRSAQNLVEDGHRFVRGPVLTTSGESAVQRGAKVFSLWPHVEGRSSASGEYENDDDLRDVLSVLAELHAVEPAGIPADHEVFRPAGRDVLERILDDPGGPWELGPYGRRARDLLDSHAGGVRRLLEHFDALVAHAPDPAEWVVTHGEPHVANVVFGADGPVLIDWDSVVIAPRERDLFMLAADSPKALDEYAAQAGHVPDPPLIRLYQADWELGEFATKFNHFRNAHGDGPDDAIHFQVLSGYLPVEPRWPELAGS